MHVVVMWYSDSPCELTSNNCKRLVEFWILGMWQILHIIFLFLLISAYMLMWNLPPIYEGKDAFMLEYIAIAICCSQFLPLSKKNLLFSELPLLMVGSRTASHFKNLRF